MPGTATLFFVNDEGWAFTCRHVAQQLAVVAQVTDQYRKFKIEQAAIPPGPAHGHAVRILANRYGYTSTTTVALLATVVNCIEGPFEVDLQMHPTLDVALLHFRRFTRLLCDRFPTFAADGDSLKQGKFLCRLGFPFPAFTNFEYDDTADEIRWTATGRKETPQFPIEGMVTRHISEANQTIGFELSTPGLRGQSGGPAFDADGRVWGMQTATSHLDLDFDVDTEVLRSGTRQRVKDSAFLHVGNCIHVNVLKQFMRERGVAFREG